MILPRFHATTTSEGPAVIDREQGLRAVFQWEHNAQAIASLLNADPAMVEAFHWTHDQGDTQ